MKKSTNLHNKASSPTCRVERVTNATSSSLKGWLSAAHGEELGCRLETRKNKTQSENAPSMSSRADPMQNSSTS